MKPIVVGELNPYGADPWYALYPLPSFASGGRLCKILGIKPGHYLEDFDRMNLCAGTWSAKKARRVAEEMSEADPSRPVILLGKKVAEAFGFRREPMFTRSGRFILFPHPSGRCQAWNNPRNVEKARAMVGQVFGEKGLAWRGGRS